MTRKVVAGEVHAYDDKRSRGKCFVVVAVNKTSAYVMGFNELGIPTMTRQLRIAALTWKTPIGQLRELAPIIVDWHIPRAPIGEDPDCPRAE